MDVNIDSFTEEFPYGFLKEREADYIERVQKYCDHVSSDQRDLVLDLLDLQWVSFIQQIWLITDKTGAEEAGKIHFALARLQINSNIRNDLGLPPRNMRDALVRGSSKDVLHLLETAD